MNGNTTHDLGYLFGLLFFGGILLAVYFIPTAVAVGRKHPYRQSIGLFNLFLGWLPVTWFVALAWAMGCKHEVRAVRSGAGA